MLAWPETVGYKNELNVMTSEEWKQMKGTFMRTKRVRLLVSVSRSLLSCPHQSPHADRRQSASLLKNERSDWPIGEPPVDPSTPDVPKLQISHLSLTVSTFANDTFLL